MKMSEVRQGRVMETVSCALHDSTIRQEEIPKYSTARHSEQQTSAFNLRLWMCSKNGSFNACIGLPHIHYKGIFLFYTLMVSCLLVK